MTIPERAQPLPQPPRDLFSSFDETDHSAAEPPLRLDDGEADDSRRAVAGAYAEEAEDNGWGEPDDDTGQSADDDPAQPDASQTRVAEAECVGTVKGPGETPHEFTFIAPDPDRRVRHGEFVFYDARVDGAPRRILGRVTGRVSVKLFPDTFLADPNVPPSLVAELIGYDSPDSELFEITVQVLGYFDEEMKEFINPRVLPSGGAPVYIAEDSYLTKVLSRKPVDAVGSAGVGSLLSRAPEAVPVALDVKGFTSTHLAIIASTGSGKSYLAGVLLEEMLKPHNRAAVLIIDPHAEYTTLQEVANHAAFRAGRYRPRVRILRPASIRVRIDTLAFDDLRYLLPDLSEKMQHQLNRAYKAAGGNGRKAFTLATLLEEVRNTGSARAGDDEQEDSTVGALIWRLESVLKGSTFSDTENLELTSLFEPGSCTVLQLDEVPQREQLIIAATLLRRTFKARVDTKKGLLTKGNSSYIPFPVFTLVEEAHNYAPAGAEVVTTRVLKTILSEGRKFGMGVGLITQRPGKLDADVLSQCMTQCIMRITNPIDQETIASSVESVGRELVRELPSLSKGQVIVSGASVNTPVLLRVRKRVCTHGGEDLDAPNEWQRWFTEGNDKIVERDAQPPSEDKRLIYDLDGNVPFSKPRT
jgi:DNA helicase HerA-like ATPase